MNGPSQVGGERGFAAQAPDGAAGATAETEGTSADPFPQPTSGPRSLAPRCVAKTAVLTLRYQFKTLFWGVLGLFFTYFDHILKFEPRFGYCLQLSNAGPRRRTIPPSLRSPWSASLNYSC